jgi:hypothetical protein
VNFGGGGVLSRVTRTLLVLAVVGATGCGDPVTPTTAELLEGSWTWVESSGGITGGPFTPASTGETMTLRFLGADSVELTRNGVLAGATTYQIFLYDDGVSTVIEYAQSLFGFTSQGLFVGEEELILRDGCCDGFIYRFQRVASPLTP